MSPRGLPILGMRKLAQYRDLAAAQRVSISFSFYAAIPGKTPIRQTVPKWDRYLFNNLTLVLSMQSDDHGVLMLSSRRSGRLTNRANMALERRARSTRLDCGPPLLIALPLAKLHGEML